MLVRRIQSQIAVTFNFLPAGRLRIQIMPVPGKYFWGIADPLLPKGNLIDYIVSDIHKRAAQCIVHLPVYISVLV